MKNQYLPIPTKPFNFMGVLGHIFAIAVVNVVTRFRQDLGICDAVRLVRIPDYQRRENVITKTRTRNLKLQPLKGYHCPCKHTICYASTQLGKQFQNVPKELCDAFQNENFKIGYKGIST